VQAALTGDTVAFDARGRQLAWLGQSGHGVVTVRLQLPAATARTCYDRFGDYVMWAGVIIAALTMLAMLVGRRGFRGFLGRTTGFPGKREAQYSPDTGQPVAS
jgi:apolipoprotein N-acyltransferase